MYLFSYFVLILTTVVYSTCNISDPVVVNDLTLNSPRDIRIRPSN